jgi:hypothetical protein
MNVVLFEMHPRQVPFAEISARPDLMAGPTSTVETIADQHVGEGHYAE